MARISPATAAAPTAGVPRPASRGEGAPSFEDALASSRRPSAPDGPEKPPEPKPAPRPSTHDNATDEDAAAEATEPVDELASEQPEELEVPEAPFDAVLQAQVERRDEPSANDTLATEAKEILKRVMRSMAMADAPVSAVVMEAAETEAPAPGIATPELAVVEELPAIDDVEETPQLTKEPTAAQVPLIMPAGAAEVAEVVPPEAVESDEQSPIRPARVARAEAMPEAAPTDAADGADQTQAPDPTEETPIAPEYEPARAEADRPMPGHRIEADSRNVSPQPQPVAPKEGTKAEVAPPVHRTIEEHFVEQNHDRLVTAMRSEIGRDGGRMQIRLDPPHLGRIELQIEVRDGVISASFQTSSDEATRLLSHSLGQLKATLETQGLSVEKMQVQQAPRQEAQGQAEDSPQQQRHGSDQQQQQQEEQRRQMMRRTWERIAARQGIDVEA